MGSKVQCENYFPVVFTDKNAGSDTRTKLSLSEASSHCAEERILEKSQFHSNLREGTMGRCSEKDKETVKHTMLKHEEIFREQVRELHRLYQIQKRLMAELKRKDSSTTLSPGAAQDGLFQIHIGSEAVKLEGKNNLWGALSGTMTNLDIRDHRQPISGVDYRQISRSALFEQNLQTGLTPQKHPPRDLYGLQHSRPMRRIFDLERPADEYMDDEATDQNEDDAILRISLKNSTEKLGSSNCDSSVEPESEVHLTLQTGCEKGVKENGRQSGPYIQLGFPDLTRQEVKEFKQSRCSEKVIIFSAASTRTEAPTRETIGKQRSVQSSQSYSGGPCKLGQEYQKREDCRSEWEIFNVDHEGSWKERRLSHDAGERSTQENPTQTHWLLKDPRLPMKIPVGNSSSQGFVWQQPMALHQQREGEADAVKQRSFGEHDARSIFLQEQWGTRYSGSREGITTGTVTPQRNPVFALVSSKGLPIDLSSTPVIGSPHGVSQGFISNSQGEIHSSGLWRNGEGTLHHFPLGVHSQNYPIQPAEIDLQMQKFDPRPSFQAQPLITSGSNGMNVKRQASEFCMGNWYQNASLAQTTQQDLPSFFHARSPSIFGQALCQTASVVESKSAQQQGAAYTMSASSPGLSIFSASNPQECSRSPWPACATRLSPPQVFGGQSIDDRKAEKEVDLTLGLSSRVTEEARKNAPCYSHGINRVEDACKNNTKQVNTINNCMHQECKHIDGEDVQSSECFARTFMELPYHKERASNTMQNIGPKEGTGFPDLLKPLSEIAPYRRPAEDIILTKHLVDNLGEGNVPSRKEKLGLGSDLTWKDLDNINGKKCKRSISSQAGESEPAKVGNFLGHSTPRQETAENNLELATGGNFMNTHIDLHGMTELAEHEMEMEAFKNTDAVFGSHKEDRFDVDNNKQICVAENKSASPSSFQSAMVAAEVHVNTNLQEATSRVLDFEAKGNSVKVSKQRELEVRHAISGCKRVERRSSPQALLAIAEPMPSEYHFQRDNRGVVEDGESPAKSSLQVPISDIGPGVNVPREGSVKAYKVSNYGQENQKGSEEAFCLSGPGRTKILRGDEVEKDIFAEKTDINELSCETIKANLPMSKYPVDLEMCNQYMTVQTRNKPNFQQHADRPQLKEVEDPSCTSQIPESRRTIVSVSRDSSNDTDLTADILLSIASEKNLKRLDADSCQFQVTLGVEKSLDWFADIILCNAECLETSTTAYGEEADNSFSSPESSGKSEESQPCGDPISKEKACSPCASNGLDFFESMTLMLKESSVEGENKSLAKQQEEIEKPHSPINHVLRPSKRGKRRRDFQREILPSISSLSRQEITEDMQIIGGLIRSTGDVWQAGCTRRSASKFASRDDWFVPLTGRRSRYLGSFRANGGSATANVNLQQAKPYDQEVERLNALSWTNAWGETIRRRRMQRHRTPVSSLAQNPT